MDRPPMTTDAHRSQYPTDAIHCENARGRDYRQAVQIGKTDIENRSLVQISVLGVHTVCLPQIYVCSDCIDFYDNSSRLL